jgi:hypothetical protein
MQLKSRVTLRRIHKILLERNISIIYNFILNTLLPHNTIYIEHIYNHLKENKNKKIKYLTINSTKYDIYTKVIIEENHITDKTIGKTLKKSLEQNYPSITEEENDI